MEFKFAIIIFVWCTVTAVCIPLDQFFPFGETTGDEELNAILDGSSDEYTLRLPFKILGIKRNSLYVNSNGMVSFNTGITNYQPEAFPNVSFLNMNETLICPFWDDVGTVYGANGKIYYQNNTASTNTRLDITRLIRESFGYHFSPTGVYIATWDHVESYSGSRNITNTFQCLLTTNGNDSFIIFLYADNLMQWTLYGAQIGIVDGRGADYFSVPNSLTNDIVNVTLTSNVNQPGVWIFKVDTSIIAASPSAPNNLMLHDTSATTTSLVWHHPINESVDYFTVSCMPYGITMRATTTSVIIRNLEEYTSYTCSVVATNIFGTGPSSDTTSFMTDPSAPSGPPENLRIEIINSSFANFHWLPPELRHQNGLIVAYRVRVCQFDPPLSHCNTLESVDTHKIILIHPSYTYKISVGAYTIAIGPYSRMTVKIPEDAPSGTPLNIRENITATTVHLEWGPPAREHQNGVILGYVINSTFPNYSNFTSLSTTQEVRPLKPFTEYQYALAAYTAVGVGPFTVLRLIRTSQDVPSGHPNNITAKILNSTSFLLVWDPPLEYERNGIIRGYQIKVELLRTLMYETETVSTRHVVANLQRNTMYYYSLAAYTDIGIGPYSNRTAVTIITQGSIKNLEVTGGAIIGVAIIVIIVLVLLCAFLARKHKKRIQDSVHRGHDVDLTEMDSDLKLQEQQFSDRKSVSTSVSSNDCNSPLPLPERCYLKDPDFVDDLNIMGQDPMLKLNENNEPRYEDANVAPHIPERQYLKDGKFVYQMNAELFPDIPELPARCYLEDTEFVRDLEGEDDNQEDVRSYSPETDTESYKENNTTVVKETPKSNVKLSSDEFSTHDHEKSTPEGHYMSLCKTTRQAATKTGQSPSAEGHYMSLCETTRKAATKTGQSPSAEGHYMSLCETTRQAATKTGQSLSESCHSEGHYMALNKKNTKQEAVKNRHHFEREYCRNDEGKVSIIDGKRKKNSSEGQYMSLCESTKEKRSFTSGEALRISQSGAGQNSGHDTMK